MNKKIIVLILCAVAQMEAMEFDISSVQKAQAQMQKEQWNQQKLQKKQNETGQLLKQSLNSYKQAPNNVGKVRETANTYIFQLNEMSRQNLELASIGIRLKALEKIIELLKQIENLRHQLFEQKSLYEEQKKATAQHSNELQSTEKQLSAEQSKSQAQENKIRQDLDEALNLLPKISAKDGQQIEKLKMGIQLLENRLDSQRARADKLWEELQAAQQKPAPQSAITRFFNWVRGRKQQAANQ